MDELNGTNYLQKDVYIRRNNSKADSIETGCITIA